MDDSCVSGSCEGTALTCDAAPPDACINAVTLRTFEGQCSLGACDYAPADMQCPGACTGDACAPHDSWTPISSFGGPHTSVFFGMVWTGSKVIAWGSAGNSIQGGAYDPVTDTWQQLPINGAPSARGIQDPVWTGTELIIWGGVGPVSHEEEDGARYNPTTNTWSPMSTTDAPTARSRNGTVWTGSEMIVWGGSQNDPWVRLDTGGRYDPATDTWTPTSMAGAPEARADFTAVWTGSEMIVWGGHLNPSPGTVGMNWTTLTNTGGRYNPTTDTWMPISTEGAPSARSSAEAVWTGSEMIVWGGQLPDFTATGTGARYNPATDTWTPISSIDAPSPRYIHNVVWTGSEMLVWGGKAGSGEAAFQTGGRYDPATDAWSPLAIDGAPLLVAPGHEAVWTGSEMIVWGRVPDVIPSVYEGARYLP